MKTLSHHSRIAGMIGNSLARYDIALFGLLTPFIAPLFFDKSDPVTALILTYGMVPLGVITKPLGSLFFGWIGDLFGRKKALFCSLLGMGIVTILMGFLPTYHQVGILAPSLLAMGRMLQSFCAAGESTGSSIFVLENTPLIQRSWVSSIYDLSSMSGTLFASGLVTFFCMQGWNEEWWRIPFWIGGITAIFGLFLRLKTNDGIEFRPNRKKWNLIQTLKENKKALLSIAIASGFSYTTYALAFTLMNGYVPLVTSLTKAEVMKINTSLNAIDMLLLPCFGYLAHKFGKEKIMLTGAICSSIFALPLFYCLEGGSIVMVSIIRLAIVVFGVAFAAPYHAWKLECVREEHRYTILSLGCTLGSGLIGAPTSVICLWLYKLLGFVWAPGLYLTLVAAMAGMVVFLQKRKKADTLEPILQ